jgi:ABC-2 type transport system ATP-binding protein
MIRIRGLSKKYKGIEALKGVDLEVPAGELFAYLGPNGAGKTTTIRILTGLTKLGGGSASLNGHDIQSHPLEAKRQCGLMPQAINLDAELTVEENLQVHGRLFGMSADDRAARIKELLEYVDMWERRTSLSKTLSGGMKRRVMIARALMHKPRILFFDEPTVGLDAGVRRRIWALIKRISQEGTTIFLTTHYIEEAEFLAQRVAFLNQGRIVALDSPQNLMAATGVWAVDTVMGHEMETSYFQDREEANQFVTCQLGGCTLRRVNLEDTFLKLTGVGLKQ